MLRFTFNIIVSFLILCPSQAQSLILSKEGLLDTVEVLTDHWGIPHIYAKNEHDLFFAQGFYAAKDRLFQFEIWRRQATGTVAEILGERELKRDIGTRLFQFRGDIEAEMNHYHPRGSLIIRSYVEGVNAYIDYANQKPEELPIEFKLLNITPKKWTPEVVISRHQGLLGNIEEELSTARAVHLLGSDKLKELTWFHPKQPDLRIDPVINQKLLFEDILELYQSYRSTIQFKPEDIIASIRNNSDYEDLAIEDNKHYQEWLKDDKNDIGSNNWVIGSSRTESGAPIMANDPHRRQSAPSLRYMAHLVAPGWNVIGGGEPEIPGISIGHNEFGSWGLTIFETDAEDLYVYQLNPSNPHQYWHKGHWESMYSIQDTISVKNMEDEFVTHWYTLHGPVLKIDETNHVAYAMRCGWLEIGGAPYLASLRMNQAKNWSEFQEACNYSHIPGENMIWADPNGNIGWQAVGIAPVRRNFSGMVPVPGDGRYEWEGYLPIISKPSSLNPKKDYINTSNENVTPKEYPIWNVIGYGWADPYRGDRVAEVIETGRQHGITDMIALQTDYLSIPARQICPYLNQISFKETKYIEAQQFLKQWDHVMNVTSIAASIYNSFERELRNQLVSLMVPKEAKSYVYVHMKRIIEWINMPDGNFGRDPLEGRNELLKQSFKNAVDQLEKKLGKDMSKWQYGQKDYKHALLKHPLSNAVNATLRSKLDVGPFPRGGNSFTVNNTSGADNQASGASFKIILDTQNWDHCVATNTPGQNGNPDHPHYRNLFELWAKDQYFPLFYSRHKIEGVRSAELILIPKISNARNK